MMMMMMKNITFYYFLIFANATIFLPFIENLSLSLSINIYIYHQEIRINKRDFPA